MTAQRASTWLRITAAAVMLVNLLAIVLGRMGAVDHPVVLHLAAVDLAWMSAVALTWRFAHAHGRHRVGAQWRAALHDAVPHPARRAFHVEFAALRALGGVVLRRPPRIPVGAVPIPQASSSMAFLAVLALVPIEAVIVEFVVPWPVVRLLIHIVEAYALLLVTAMVFAPRHCPHFLHEGKLALRSGTDTIASISVTNIVGIRSIRDAASLHTELTDGVLRLPGPDGCTVELCLRSAQPVTLPSLRHDRVGEADRIRFATSADLHTLLGR